ncbi:MaoC family dehydratase [Amycolatopsis sp. H20-H5]|uniref:MaoC family dehydratase n=1 Tax=Amycolatopsis sp. H20-H5 TaxID=3046309 RepID=UPI002DC02761|nr:MaoC family dehydratase [Amycolatopsis sp. H20-H5]MEC3978204.1 MaoC family dehydratase [Amycolatopsis sp. H20-H5]
MRVFVDVGELVAAQGQHLGRSPWCEVSQQTITSFAEATGDRQWIHVDPERAVTGPFGRTVAHGYYLLAVLPALLGDIFEVERAGSVVNTGVDTLRFHRPVPVASRIRAAARLASVRVSRRGVAELAVEVEVEVEGVDAPACTAVVHSMIRPVRTRPGSAGGGERSAATLV